MKLTMNKKVIYLASQSGSRKKLLDLAQIPYKTIEHRSDECAVPVVPSFKEYVLSIARDKMDHVVLPTNFSEGTDIFVLTADTLIRTAETKKILGKPENMSDAKRMLLMLRSERAELVTACCFDKKVFSNGEWGTVAKEHWTTSARFSFIVEENFVDTYFEKMPHALNACGAGIVEDFGLNFLKDVEGSFTAIIGLPLFELGHALSRLQ